MTERSDRTRSDGVRSDSTLPDRAQVVIVGGGVIGCSIAYHLAHLGWTDVVLLEQHALTAGTTWHAAGLITSAGMTDETALFFSRYSRDLYARLEAETGHSTGFRAVGHLSLATSRERQDALRREAADVSSHRPSAAFGSLTHTIAPFQRWPASQPPTRPSPSLLRLLTDFPSNTKTCSPS